MREYVWLKMLECAAGSLLFGSFVCFASAVFYRSGLGSDVPLLLTVAAIVLAYLMLSGQFIGRICRREEYRVFLRREAAASFEDGFWT